MASPQKSATRTGVTPAPGPGTAQPSRRLAKPLASERYLGRSREATLAAPPGQEPLDRFELAVAFAIREAKRQRNERFGRREIDTEGSIG